MIRDGIDLVENYDGDLVLEDGDLKDTSFSPGLTYYQLIRTVMSVKPGEYALFPRMGVDLDVYKGNVIGRRESYEMAKVLKEAIHQQTVLYSREINIEPFPVNKDSIAFYFNILTVQDDNVGVGIVFDSRDGNFRTIGLQDGSAAIKVVTVKAQPTINRRVQ